MTGQPSISLLLLMEEDRAENRSVVAGTPGYAALRARDAKRRILAVTILDAGGVLSNEELFAAAWLFNHGDTADEVFRAHQLAKQAADLGHRAARYLSAAALDRSLMYSGRPQRFGTNLVPDGARYRVWDVDPKTTDAERARWDVPPLAELHRRAAETSEKMAQPASFHGAPQWMKDAIKRWKPDVARD